MKTKIIAGAFVLAALVFAGCASAPSWQTDFDTAQETAREQNKDMFLYFSGSDWDVPSQTLKSAILDKDTFAKKAAKDFVLVNLDFPESEGVIDEEQMNKNFETAQRYYLQAFPTVLLLSSDGDVYGQVPYDETVTDPAKYLETVKSFDAVKKQRADLKKKIAAASGAEKVVLIDSLFEMTSPEYRGLLGEYIEEIPALDPNNQTGLRGKYDLQLAYNAAMDAYASGDGALASQKFLDVIATGILDPAQIQEAYYMAAYLQAISGTADETAVIGMLQKAVDADPENPNAAEILYTIEQIRLASEQQGE